MPTESCVLDEVLELLEKLEEKNPMVTGMALGKKDRVYLSCVSPCPHLQADAAHIFMYFTWTCTRQEIATATTDSNRKHGVH